MILSKKLYLIFAALTIISSQLSAQGTRLLRQPSMSADEIAFEYGGDIWVVSKNGGDARRITSTAAFESNPVFSPDGSTIAFTSNRSGVPEVYSVSVKGGTPKRITWYPAPSIVRAWTPDGKNILYTSPRETAPTGYGRLWTVPASGGPSTLLAAPWGNAANYSPDGKQMVIDRVARWDVEWRHYRGGQNTALQIMDLNSLAEKSIPNERTMDLLPVWMGDDIYFLSDRDFIMNVWVYNTKSASLKQLTDFNAGDIKWLAGNGKELAFERGGYLYLLDAKSGKSKQLEITVNGDFPWAETRWENVTGRASNAGLSPTGKRIVLEARGEIFTVPVENGDPRNLTQSSDAADRNPLWSPDGKQIAWFSDKGGQGYALYLSDQEGNGEPKKISIGESKLAWEPCWSPDGKYIAFEDNSVRIKVIELVTGKITDADVGGANIERGNMSLSWSPDSKWLMYSKTGTNNFRRITVWSLETGKATPISDPLADAQSPVWDRDGRHLYFLASTNLGLGSGWANTSAIQAQPTFSAYIVTLRKNDPNPFPLKSDEETVKSETKPEAKADTAKAAGKPKDSTNAKSVLIDFDKLEVRTLTLPTTLTEFNDLVSGPKGSVFIIGGSTLSKFTLEGKKTDEFAKNINYATT